jgi:ubiquinone/menaquinone biosynthesis C-methylase UbiE
VTGELQGFDPKATYSAAAEDYARASAKFWQFLSERTVERLRLLPGQSVLDVACGTAPATIAAARAVGSGGRVIGVDYAEGMLDVARRNVAAEGLSNVELVQGDMLALPYGPEFDAVMCVLGIFFVEDMSAAARALWSHVRPGGMLAVATLGPAPWDPMIGQFVDESAKARPDIELVLPWRRTEDRAVLEEVLRLGDIPDPVVSSEVRDIPFEVGDWWLIVMGSGLRRIAVDLGDAASAVRAKNEQWAREHNVTSVRVAANYAFATKPA